MNLKVLSRAPIIMMKRWCSLGGRCKIGKGIIHTLNLATALCLNIKWTIIKQSKSCSVHQCNSRVLTWRTWAFCHKIAIARPRTNIWCLWMIKRVVLLNCPSQSRHELARRNHSLVTSKDAASTSTLLLAKKESHSNRIPQLLTLKITA